jgi:hypothetical protein
MMKLTWRRIALFGALVLVLAAVGAYVLRDFGFAWNPLNGRNGAVQQNATAASDQGTPGGMAAGSGNAYPVAGGRSAGSQSGVALGLLEEWVKSITKNEGSGAPELIQSIMQSLHDNPNGNAAFYQRLRQVIEDQSIDASRKLELIAALDRAATPAALQLLVELSQGNLPANLKQVALNAIAHTGEYYWDKQSLAQVAPVLQQLWLQSEGPELLRSVAMAMAKVGDAASINALMETVLNNSRSLADIEHSNDPRISAAWAALKGNQSPGLIPVLQGELQSSTNGLQASVAANLLAGMVQVEATQALFSWAQGAGDKYATVAGEAFAKIQTYDSLQFLNSALAQNPPFKSNLVRTAILAAVKK